MAYAATAVGVAARSPNTGFSEIVSPGSTS
jgi:hypothetical protein